MCSVVSYICHIRRLFLRLTIRHIRGSLWVLNLALAVVTVLFLIGAIRNLFAHPEPTPEQLSEPSLARVVQTQPALRPSEGYEALKKSNLFGALSSANVAPERDIEEKLPETTLELELLGCVTTGSTESSFAIIRNKRDRKEDTYSVGDFVAGNAKVEEIRESEVIIYRAGKRETLSMAFGASSGVGRGALSRERQRYLDRYQQSRGGRPREPSRSTAPAIRAISNNVRVINREKLTQDVSQNLGSLLNQFRTRPNVVNNQPSGVIVDSVGSDPLSAQSGLKPGDIVKRINGVSVNSLEDVLAMSERLQQSREIRAVIERDGRHTTLIYKIQ